MLEKYGLLSGNAYAKMEACANAEPLHLSHQLRNFATLLTLDSAVELCKWFVVSK